MERKTSLEKAKKIMGENFIGPEELLKISKSFQILIPKKNIPAIPFGENCLKNNGERCILVLGLPKDKQGKFLTINRMREIFGLDPKKSEPCFYNQDWYLKEKFAKAEVLKFKWYLVKKEIDKKTRGKDPEEIDKKFKKRENFPSAVLLAYIFFAYYLCNNKILWKNDFLWCKDKDSNGDRIYVGRYEDSKKVNKKGFNIHRHLSVRPCYGFVSEIL